MIRTYRSAGILVMLALLTAACTGGGGATTAPSAATQPPASEAPASEAPASEAPASEAPASEAPASEAPASEAPATEAPSATPHVETASCEDPVEPDPNATGTLTGELEMWHSYSSGAGTELDALCENLARVRADNPGLTVTVTEIPFDQIFNRINVSWAVGETRPDMFIAPNDSLGFQAREGILADLSAYEAELGSIGETSIAGSKVDGVLYEIPESVKQVAMYYNAETVQTPPASTDDLIAAVDGGTKVALFEGANGLYHNFGWWAAFGGELMDENGVCIADQGGVADAMQFLVDLQDAGATLTPDYNVMADGFKNGEFDIIVDGPWALGGYRDAVENLGVAPMPEGPAGPSKPLLGVDGFYINASTPDVDLAARFALAMTDAESQAVWSEVGGHVPADTTVEITSEHVQAFADAAVNSVPRPQNEELNNFWGNFGNAQAMITEQGADPVQAIADACAAMNETNQK